MTGYEQFLVVVLATFLAIFLLLGIVFLVFAIKIVRVVRRLSEKAEHVADRAEAAAEFFQKAAGPLAVGRIMTQFAERFFENGKRRGRKD